MVNVKSGAENGTRTRDPDLGKVVLYQLSYFRRNAGAKIVLFIVTSKGFTYFKTLPAGIPLAGFPYPYCVSSAP